MIQEHIVETRKNYKRNQMLQVIRYGEKISRHELKKQTGLSMTTVLNTVEELIRDGLITEEICQEVRTGRKPTWLHLNPESRFFLGVEFIPDVLHCVILDFSFHCIYSSQTPFSKGVKTKEILEAMQQQIRGALKFLGEKKKRVMGIGLGIPGYLDREAGVGLEYPEIADWKNVPVKKIVEEEFGYPVSLENNINAMTIAYRWEHYQEKADDFILVSLKYGAKFGLFLDNRLYIGNRGIAGELAHMKLPGCNRLCTCGRRGCVNTEVPLLAIRNKIMERMEKGQFQTLKKLTGGKQEKIQEEIFVDLARKGDVDSLALLRETGSYLGMALAPVVTTLNPKKVVIASDSNLGGGLFSEVVQQEIYENAPPLLSQDLHVTCEQVGGNLGARGAGVFAWEQEFWNAYTEE